MTTYYRYILVYYVLHRSPSNSFTQRKATVPNINAAQGITEWPVQLYDGSKMWMLQLLQLLRCYIATILQECQCSNFVQSFHIVERSTHVPDVLVSPLMSMTWCAQTDVNYLMRVNWCQWLDAKWWQWPKMAMMAMVQDWNDGKCPRWQRWQWPKMGMMAMFMTFLTFNWQRLQLFDHFLNNELSQHFFLTMDFGQVFFLTMDFLSVFMTTRC